MQRLHTGPATTCHIRTQFPAAHQRAARKCFAVIVMDSYDACGSGRAEADAFISYGSIHFSCFRKQGLHVFGGHICLQGFVAGRNDEAGGENFAQFAHLGGNLLGSTVGQQFLGIDAAAEGNLSSEFFLQAVGLHTIRLGLNGMHNIHTRFDTRAVMSETQMLKDIDFLCAFTQRMACARFCPVARTMPDNMKEQLDYYLLRKRKPE